MSFVDLHDSGVGLVVEVQGAGAHDLLVDECRLARSAGPCRVRVVHLVKPETLSVEQNIEIVHSGNMLQLCLLSNCKL